MLGIWHSEMERIWKRKSTYSLYVAYILIIVAIIWSYKMTGTKIFRFGEGSMLVNNLNLPWLMMSEVALFLTLAMLPILYVDQLSGDLYSGAYRLYMLRPYRRLWFWLAKMLALSITTVIFVGTGLFISVLAGWFLFPHSSTFLKYGASTPSTLSDAITYILTFYLILLMVCLVKLMLSSAVCLFVSRPLFAYLSILVLSVFLFKLARPLIMLMDPFREILLALRIDNSFEFWMCTGGMLVVGIIVSCVRWQKRVF
ncbi:ABC transporter permease [Paenibacillus polymyxa]|uniref:ABC transporter permease n=1 Tax=unclassified Paenibacillus TaxID=185978 RepID=UPI0011B10104|nr:MULTISPECIES: ABC transporter permease [unclassified Paenibacillus]KAF6567688.1 ABC transporter permease [Paenibacillus sp. EKM202P]KAF6573197.1 ABC transporter permease [Paenibacillus sp. EKM207P]QDY84630.1 ABC transporter permease [Paenibacillus polymyxa]